MAGLDDTPDILKETLDSFDKDSNEDIVENRFF